MNGSRIRSRLPSIEPEPLAVPALDPAALDLEAEDRLAREWQRTKSISPSSDPFGVSRITQPTEWKTSHSSSSAPRAHRRSSPRPRSSGPTRGASADTSPPSADPMPRVRARDLPCPLCQSGKSRLNRAQSLALIEIGIRSADLTPPPPPHSPYPIWGRFRGSGRTTWCDASYRAAPGSIHVSGFGRIRDWIG